MLWVNSFLPKKLSNFFLLLVSLLFYAWGERVYYVIMILSVLINYFLGLAIAKKQDRSKWILGVGVVVNLSFLLYFKYANFLIENVNSLLGFVKFDIHFNLIKNLSLPIGISFFTFHSLSYLIDVYRKNTEPQKSLIDLGLYIALFPQLIAGPIVRYHNIESQLKNRIQDNNNYIIGTERFIIGLAKKLILANSFAYVADYIFAIPNEQVSSSLAWIGIIAYSLQIYFDFSGYSDMAIGLARILGFHFLENFNYPYISTSIKEFWRRWHISLSSWFRDYLYIPLGGSKVSNSRHYINILIVFLVTGLWHGASWNFIIWGLVHGMILVIERLFLEKLFLQIPSFLSRIYTLLVVVTAWVFFRAEDLPQSITFIKKMYSFGASSSASASHLKYIISSEFFLILILGFLFSTPLITKLSVKIHTGPSLHKYLYHLALLCLFLVSLTYLAAGTYNPFIYFRF